MTFYPYTDDRFRYYGVWERDGETIIAHWNRAFAKVGFTGERITVEARASGYVFMFVDDVPVYNGIPDGQITLQVPTGRHILSIEDPESGVQLAGVLLPAGEELFCPARRPYVLFVGDSISSTCPGFTFASGAALDAEYAVQASSGIALRDGWGWRAWDGSPEERPGMQSAFFQLGQPSAAAAYLPRDVQVGEAPDALVVFLGTNDYLDTPADEAADHISLFAAAYCDFIGAVRECYPHVTVYMLQALSDRHCRRLGIQAAYNAVSAAYEDVYLVRSDLWDVELSEDGTHPSERGYQQMTQKMCEYLEERFLSKEEAGS